MNEINRFLTEEDGVGVVEIILILVVLIAAVALFKGRITELIKIIFNKIDSQAGKI